MAMDMYMHMDMHRYHSDQRGTAMGPRDGPISSGLGPGYRRFRYPDIGYPIGIPLCGYRHPISISRYPISIWISGYRNLYMYMHMYVCLSVC